MRRRRIRRRRPPRLAAALAAAGLVVAAGAVGWAVQSRGEAEEAALTATHRLTKVVFRAPPAPAELQAALDKLAERYREPVGIAVTDVDARWTAQVAGDEVFPQQSVSKLWVALSVLHAIDRGGMSLEQKVVLTSDDRSVFYQPVTAHIRGSGGYETTVSDLLRRALTESDNAANDKLIRELGGGGAVSRTLTEKGLDGLGVGETERDLQTRAAGLTWKPEYGVTWIWKAAREQLPEPVRDQALAEYLAHPPDGAKPAAITQTLAALKRGELLSPASTQVMLELMGECRTGGSRLRAGLPRGWSIAHKTGTGPDWKGASIGINDVGLITAPDGHSYAVAVMLRETRKPVPARQALMQAVARTVAGWWRSEGGGALAPSRQVATIGAPSETAR
jgi:beta-lactamase class A